jgi:Peptidase family M28
MIPVRTSTSPDRVASRRRLLTTGALVLLSAVVPACSRFLSNGYSAEEASADKPDAARAKRYLEQICKIGPRISGSKGMQTQQKLLVDHFTKYGAKVSKQLFDGPHPLTGNPVRFTNLIVSWNPKAKERVLLACHYDTRPLPDEDRRNPRGTFIGANDGASGVALFMEMAHHMKEIKPAYGVDFVFFDGEELVYGAAPIDRYFIGSRYFASQYVKAPPKHKYVWGVVVDMVADRKLELYMEKNSLRLAPRLTKSIWATARRLGVREFIRRDKHEIQDDHLPLNQTAKIPSCDIIDFDYPYWHTTLDVPAKCSGASLAKVARVLLKWLEEVPKPEK